MPVIPVLTSWRHKDQLKVILGYKVSYRIAWATWDPVLRKVYCNSASVIDSNYGDPCCRQMA